MTLILLQGHLRYCKRFRCLYLKNTTNKVNYSCRTSYLSCCYLIQPEGVLYDAERDLLAIAKFPVKNVSVMSFKVKIFVRDIL